MRILLQDFSAEVGTDDTFTSTIRRVYMKLVMIMELEQYSFPHPRI
jgi:hypothetical protein